MTPVDRNLSTEVGRLDSPSQSKRLAFADGLRGLAACWVVLFHMSEGEHIEALRAAIPAVVYRVLFSMGDLGVPVFFVLSGYVMALSTAKLNFNASVGLRFVVRRLIRLIPAYYFAIAFILALSAVKYKVMGQGFIHFDLQILAAHAFLLQGVMNIKNIDPVFWTLCIEIQFYVVFAMLMWAQSRFSSGGGEGGKRYYFLYGLLLSSAVALLWPLGFVFGSLWPGGFLPYWYCFMAGVWACVARDGTRLARICAISYALIVMASGLWITSGVALTAATTALLLMWVAYCSKEGVWLSSRWIQFLGLISYSLYLIHNPLTGATFNVFKRFSPSGPVWDAVGIALVAAVCVLGSYMAYLLIERPSIALSRRVRLVATPAPATPCAN